MSMHTHYYLIYHMGISLGKLLMGTNYYFSILIFY